MSFLSPFFLLGLAAVAAPLVLHLFARENAPVKPLPTARFVPRAEVQQTARRHLQDVALLLLRVLAVALLVLAFARPFLDRGAAGAERDLTIVLLDRSFSMGGAAREAQWRQQARDVVDGVPAGSRVALLTFDREAQIVVSPTTSRAEILDAIDKLRPGYGSTNYAAALRAGIDVARGRPAQVVVISDGQRTGMNVEALPPIPSTLDVTMRTVAPPAENLAVDVVDRNDAGVFALVANHGLADRPARLEWRLDGAPLAEQRISVPSEGTTEVRLDRQLPSTGVLSVSVDDAVGYAADNVRYFVLDPSRPLPVFVIESVDAPAEASLYARAALDAANSAAPVFSVSRVRADDRRLSSADGLRAARVLLLIGTRGLVRDARLAIAEAVRNGTGLVVAAGPDVEPGVVRELLGEAGRALGDATAPQAGLAAPGGGAGSTAWSLVAKDLRHPVLAALGETAGNLGQVRVDRAWMLRPVGTMTTLVALSSGSPALTEVAVGHGRAFVISTDLGRRWNTWPLHPTFVPMLVECVRHASHERPALRQALVGDLAGETGARPGVTTLDGTGARVAVNVDPREGRVEAVGAEEFARGLEHVPVQAQAPQLRRDAEAEQRWWRGLLWALLAVLAVEAIVASRRRRGEPVTVATRSLAELGERP